MTAIDPKSVREVLLKVPGVLRALKEENEKLASALKGYQRREEAEEIVSAMDARGFSDNSVPFKKKVASLLASKKDLGVVKEALALSSPDLSFASISDEEFDLNAATAFENFILGD